MEKIKYKDYTIIELIHLWANCKIEKEIKRGNWIISNLSLYYKNTLVGFHYNKKKVLIAEFNGNGSFGNGSSSSSILRAIPDNKVGIIFNQIFINKNSYTKEWALSEIIKHNEYTLNKVAVFREYIDNNRIFTVYDTNLNLNTNNLELFDKKLLKSIQNKEIETKSEYKQYKGWSSNYTLKQSFNIKFKIKDFNLEHFFTEEEIEILKMKNWIHKFGKNPRNTTVYTHTLKQFKEIWFSERREEFKKQQEDFYKKVSLEIETKNKRELDKNIIKALNNIERFRNNIIRVINDLPYSCVRMVNDKIIQTTQGVMLSTIEAKKAFRLFKASSLPANQTIGDFTYLGIKEKPIPYLENGELKYRNENCLIIGCHTIPESEINEFINFYKLDWK